MLRIQAKRKKIAFTHFQFISPLPKNTEEILSKFDKIIVAEQNNGQFASYLKSKIDRCLPIYKFNRVEGQPFMVETLVDEFIKIMEK
jgi:2-oxoglutarate ferredoxin oxidoreductase subunit alpha